VLILNIITFSSSLEEEYPDETSGGGGILFRQPLIQFTNLPGTLVQSKKGRREQPFSVKEGKGNVRNDTFYLLLRTHRLTNLINSFNISFLF
jgi:hypothetical protein